MNQLNRQFLKRLREETNPAHMAVEQAVNITDKIQSLETYKDLLKRFYGFYQPIENRIAKLSFEIDDKINLPTRAKTGWLMQDLAYLGLNEKEIDSLPRCKKFPTVETLPELLGYLYVAEGSTLGGQIISKMIQESIQVTDSSGGRFFNAYGSNIGIMWRNFGDYVCEYVLTEKQENAVIQSAKVTFECFESWIK